MQISQHQGSNITMATSQGREALPVTDAGTTAPKDASSTPKENRITVNISQQAREKLAGEQATTGKSKKSEEKESPAIERIKKRIKLIKERLEKAKEELRELKSQNLDPEKKKELIKAKKAEIVGINSELSRANTQLADVQKKQQSQNSGDKGAGAMTRPTVKK